MSFCHLDIDKEICLVEKINSRLFAGKCTLNVATVVNFYILKEIKFFLNYHPSVLRYCQRKKLPPLHDSNSALKRMSLYIPKEKHSCISLPGRGENCTIFLPLFDIFHITQWFVSLLKKKPQSLLLFRKKRGGYFFKRKVSRWWRMIKTDLFPLQLLFSGENYILMFLSVNLDRWKGRRWKKVFYLIETIHLILTSYFWVHNRLVSFRSQFVWAVLSRS